MIHTPPDQPRDAAPGTPLDPLLDSAVENVFRLALGLSCSPLPAPRTQPSGLRAIVHLSGAAQGVFTFSLDPGTASFLAAALSGLREEEITFDIQLDAVGELCNMVAGTWKRLQKRSLSCCTLSTPAVTCDQPATAETAYKVEGQGAHQFGFGLHWTTALEAS